MLIINIPHDSNTTSRVGTQEVSRLDTWHYRNRVLYLRKVIENEYMQNGQKMLYHWGATSIEIPSIVFLKPNEILKWFLNSKNVCPYLELEQNKKEFIVVKCEIV